jgi:hypothetical protein
MKPSYQAGDIVLVNNRAFVASPVPSAEWTECKVLLPSSSSAQIYVSPVSTPGSPLYIFISDIKGNRHGR